MNIKLIKRVAVASLAAIIIFYVQSTNRSLNSANIIYGRDATDWDSKIKIAEDHLNNFLIPKLEEAKTNNNEKLIEKWQKRVDDQKEKIKEYKNKQKLQQEESIQEAQKQAAKELNETSDDEETNQQVKGSYANDIERTKIRIEALKKEIEDAKINNPSMVDFLEKELHRENEDIEFYILLEQYIINEDPNTDPELIKKWNINNEDKTEFSFYNDTYDSSGGKTRAFTKIYNDNNVKTNLDPNRYTVKSLSLPGEYHYIIVDNMPNYHITYKRDDMNIRINRVLTYGNIVECDYQIFDFTLECPISAPINGDRKYSKLVFNPYDINLYRIKRSELTKKEEYIVTLGVQIKENEELSKGINNYEIARILRQTEVYPPTNNLMVSHERISAENINIKTLEFRVEYSNKQLSLGLAPEWD